MGLDIGVVKGIEWSKRPSAALGGKLTNIACDGFGEAYLSLSEVRETCNEFIAETDDPAEKEHARDVLNWWTQYWHDRGLEDTDSLTVTFDS